MQQVLTSALGDHHSPSVMIGFGLKMLLQTLFGQLPKSGAVQQLGYIYMYTRLKFCCILAYNVRIQLLMVSSHYQV